MRISEILPHAEIEHIGSSAIKGALSKGDLDILVRVKNHEFHAALSALQSLGFRIKEDTRRTEWLCMLEDGHESAIQLIESGSQGEMFVQFRDHLNGNPALVKKYNDLKNESTGLSPETYRKRKSEFIECVLKKMDVFHSVLRDGKKYTWSTKRLWELSKDLTPFDFEISSFDGFDEDIWFGDYSAPTVRKVLDHHRKIQEADFTFPIIIGADGTVMDGVHRICRAYLEGRKTIPAVRFNENPPPDEITNGEI